MEINLPQSSELASGNGADIVRPPSPSLKEGQPPVAQPELTRKPRRVWRYLALLAGLALIVTAVVIVGVNRADKSPLATVKEPAVVSVPAARVSREDVSEDFRIPGEFRPYQEVELHAKVSGYLSEIPVDFGDRVKAGQLLATLEVPELKDQLHSALAVKQRAEADYKAAHFAYTRLSEVDKGHPNLVAQQELDSAESKDAATEAAIAAAKADVERYQTLLAYTRITAPFDGVITRRYADPGALIQAGTTSETQSMPLVRVSDNYRLRLDFPVSVKYVKDIHAGDQVDVQVTSLNNKTFRGTITRATLRVNEDTRKMTTEIEVPNPNLEMVPGMYAWVVLKGEQHKQALAIPIEAVPPGNNSSVYVINDAGLIEDRAVTLGLDTPYKYEVIAGLKEGELVFTGSRSQVQPGQRVRPLLNETSAKQ
jgi:RND family efflux transporter MFP subunit